jgi:long-chain fatty acid transport protein
MNHWAFHKMTRRMAWGLVSLVLSLTLTITTAHAGGLWLYEGGTPDLGTAAAGRAALAADASTAGVNPAGMSRLDRSQMLVALQGIYADVQFDTELSGFGGGDGGNAGGFVPSGSLHYVHPFSDDFRPGISVGSYLAGSLD